MNADVMKGKWLQLRGEIKRQWSRLTDDDLGQIEGSTETMLGKLQERYGIARDEAERELNAFLNRHSVA
jgi:uncharacterized protein YjbJ (UPF0337 family)